VLGSFDSLIPYVSQALGCAADRLEHAFRPAERADLPAILALRRSVHRNMWWDDEAFVRWRYFHRTVEDGTVPYWVFAPEREILGACGLEPVVLFVDGRPTHAIRTMDIMVRPDIDGRGLGAFMNLALFKKFPITMVTGSNASSHQLLSRLFQHALDLTFWRVVIETRELINERLGVRPLSALIGAGADIVMAMARRRHSGEIAGLHIAEIARFESDVTALSTASACPGRVIVQRSAEYLNWRFIDNPRCRYRVLGAYRGGGLIGYVVTRMNLARPNPRREAEIVDWLVAGHLTDGAPVLAALIGAGLRSLIDAGAGVVTCAAFVPGLKPAVEANGFQFRAGQLIPFFVRASSAEVHQRLAAADGWFLTRGDYDVE
jgi:hypothetical protein